MQTETLLWVRCPRGCSRALQLEMGHIVDGQILSGRLCCRVCGEIYPIEESIPRLILSELREETPTDALSEEIEKKREAFREHGAQSELCERLPILNMLGDLEISRLLERMELPSDAVLLEAGCGTGRMTVWFAGQCKRVIAIDPCLEALHKCRDKLHQANLQDVDLIQADVCALPFPPETFTHGVCGHMLEYLPTPTERLQLIQELARTVKPKSLCVVMTYRTLWLLHYFVKREKPPPTELAPARMSRRELTRLLVRSFEVEGIQSVLLSAFVAYCRKPFTAQKDS